MNKRNTASENSKKFNKKNMLHQKDKISNSDIYGKITDIIIKKLEEGTIPWENPVINNCRPQNIITNHIYSGINTLILSNSRTPYFMTFNQAKEIGANVKKGASGLPVIFWSVKEKIKIDEETDETEKERYFLLKYFNVFNISDIENLPEKYLSKIKAVKTDFSEVKTAEEIIKNYLDAPKFEYCSGTPHYSPGSDTIRTPAKEYFKNSNHYYSTIFHEMGHSTGHEKRLNRFKNYSKAFKFGDSEYAKEELTAELTAAFLMAETKESLNINNKAAYIKSWLTVLQNDKRMIINSSCMAQKAVKFILFGKEVESDIQKIKEA